MDTSYIPMMEDRLAQLMANSWPPPVVVQIHQSNKWFGTLLAFAKAEKMNVEKLPKDAYFEVTIGYDYLNFQNFGRVWKALFKVRENATCVLYSYSRRFPLKNTEAYYKGCLVEVSNVIKEILVEVPPVEVAVRHRKGDSSPDVTVPYWRFVPALEK